MSAIALENARSGTLDWALRRPAVERRVEGFAGAASVQRGEDIDLFVHTTSDRVVVEIFRVGWYGGLGACLVRGPHTLPGHAQAMPTPDPVTGLCACRWTHPICVTTADADGVPWCTGVYLARLTETEHGTQSYVIFVVRDDDSRAASIVQLPFATYQAYNNWGGKSLYHWGSGGARASHVSFDRPFAANPAAPHGAGAGEFLTNLQPAPEDYGPSNAGWDVNMVRWLERHGCDVTYTTSLDTHAGRPAPRRHRAWLSIGHDEYWSWAMRDHVEATRDAGTNLGFFGANDAYWQVRFEAREGGGAGSADRVMICHKKAKADPLRGLEPGTRQLTDKWRHEKIARPEDDLLGVMYQADPVDSDIVIHDPSHWALEGTGLKAGDRLPGLLGYEVDGVHDAAKAQRMGVEVIAASPWVSMNDDTRRGKAHMVCHTAPGGALVFAAGSIQWAWGLDDYNVPALRRSRRHAACERITRNVLTRFGGWPDPAVT